MGDDEHEQHHNAWLELQQRSSKTGQSTDIRSSSFLSMSLLDGRRRQAAAKFKLEDKTRIVTGPIGHVTDGLEAVTGLTSNLTQHFHSAPAGALAVIAGPPTPASSSAQTANSFKLSADCQLKTLRLRTDSAAPLYVTASAKCKFNK